MMKGRISLVVGTMMVLMVGAMVGMFVLVSRTQMITEIRIAQDARIRANMAEREAHAARSQVRDLQNFAEARAGNESAVRGSEIESLRRENDGLRSRIKAIEDAQKVKTDPQGHVQEQGPPGACVP